MPINGVADITNTLLSPILRVYHLCLPIFCPVLRKGMHKYFLILKLFFNNFISLILNPFLSPPLKTIIMDEYEDDFQLDESRSITSDYINESETLDEYESDYDNSE